MPFWAKNTIRQRENDKPLSSVLLLHGDKDNIVPLWCSEKYLETYGERATLHVIPGVNHTITTRRNEVVRYAVDFFRQLGSSMK